MNTDLSKLKFNFDVGTFRILYYRHKSYIVPVVVILASFLVFIFVVLGQVSDYLSGRDQIAAEQQKITILQNNLNMLTALPDLGDDLQTVEAALPPEKDFAGIINAISAASSITGISVSDYTFQVGTLTGGPSDSSLPTLPVVITIQSGPDGTRRFLSALEKTSPLSSVLSLGSDPGSTTLRIVFYYKPLPSVRVDYTVPFASLSQKNKDLLKQLSDWQSETKTAGLSPAKPATASASL